MEVHFTPEQTAQLAAYEGINTEGLIKDAALQLLEADARFRAAVRKRIERADHGELIDEEEMDARIQRMFGSWREFSGPQPRGQTCISFPLFRSTIL